MSPNARAMLARSFRADELVEHRGVGTSSRRWERATRTGSLRAAVFGVNDGLVSNLALVMGVAGASPGGRVIVIASLAGLLAGAFSMAAGEYVSMRVQAEVAQRALAIEMKEIAEDPEGERVELASMFLARGYSADLAERMAAEAMGNPALALSAHAREELGIDPDHLGSPPAAAASSFATFAVGALVPLLPYLFASGASAAVQSLLASLAALFSVGSLTARLGGRPSWKGGLRMLVIGGTAAGLTFGIGSLFGVTNG